MNKQIRYSKRLRGESPECGIYSNKCSICLENKEKDFFNENPFCNHNICMGCLNKWSQISESNNCPTCKKSLVYIEENGYNYYYDNDDDKLYPPLYFRFIPPPRWLGKLFVSLFQKIHTIIWINNGILFGDYENDDENDDENNINWEQLDGLHMALE